MTTAAEHRSLLAGCAPFGGLSPEQLDEVLQRTEVVRFAAGEKLIRQAVRGDALLILASGTAAVIVVDGVASPTEVAEVGRGDVVGEMALISGERTSADVVARTDVTALRLPAPDFHELARRHPEIAVVLTHLIADRLGRRGTDAMGGKLVHGYRIARTLGRGGMAVVYEARRESDGRAVALKMMSHKLAYDPSALERFRVESRLLEGFDHPNLARLVGRFSGYGTHFLAVEYCRGPSLDRVAAVRRPLPEAVVRPIVGQIAAALGHVHSKGVLHRDVKPSNAMFADGGQVKLLDFGIAAPVAGLDDRTQTIETGFVGTPFYMAPEQIEDANAIDERADHYALACLAYELLAGRRLFREGTRFAIWKQKTSLDLEPAAEIGDGVSGEMYAFLRKNLRPDPAHRTGSVAALESWAAPVDPEGLPVAEA